MGLSTYTELQAEIAAHLDRSDLTSYIPDFVTIFETTANTELELRTRHNTTSTTLSLTSSSPLVALPSDFLEAKTLIDITSYPVRVLTPYTPTSLYTNVNTPTTPGPPMGFTIVGSNVEVQPTADQAYSLKLYYYQKVTPLATTSPNWLLTNFPTLYLYGSLIAAEAFLGSDSRIETWGNIYDNMRLKIAGATERGQYGATPLSVKVDAVV